MSLLINNIIAAILQIAIFIFIPFIFFLFRKDRNTHFLKWIGLYKPTSISVLYALLTSFLFLAAAIGMIFIDAGTKQSMLAPKSVTGNLHLMGLNPITICILLIIAVFKTAFAEEILFRGFIAKQLIKKFGFANGNILQAIIFGLVHLLLFGLISNTTFISLTFIFLFASAAAWVIGYINDKHARGSIVPGWIAHAVGNAFSYYIIAFLL